MSAVYNTDLSRDEDVVRFNIGDTDVSPATDAEFSDEELTATLASEGSVVAATVACFKALIAKYARKASITNGRLSIQWGDVAKSYQEALATFQTTSTTGAVGVATGVTFTQRDRLRDDTDRIQPRFTRGMFRNPKTRGPTETLDPEETDD